MAEDNKKDREAKLNSELKMVDLLCYFPFIQTARTKIKGQTLETLPLRLRHDVIKIDFKEILHAEKITTFPTSHGTIQLPARLKTQGSDTVFLLKDIELVYYPSKVGICVLNVVLPTKDSDNEVPLVALDMTKSLESNLHGSLDLVSESDVKQKRQELNENNPLPTVQTVLDLQLALVEMKNAVLFAFGGAYEKITFREIFHAILDSHLNAPGVTYVNNADNSLWHPDIRFVKLFVFSRILLPDPEDRGVLQRITYFLGALSTKVRDLEDEVVDAFLQKHGYLRWAPAASYVIHGYGGVLVQVGDPVHQSQSTQTKWAGHSLMLEQVVHPVLFQRTFLSSTRIQLNEVIEETEWASKLRQRFILVKKLKGLHGEVLRFKAKHFTGNISDSNANKAVFDMWAEFLDLNSIAQTLEDGIRELSNYYRDIAAEKQQERIDLLGIVLGFLGLAALGLDLANSENLWVGSALVGIFCLLALVFLFLKPYITG